MRAVSSGRGGRPRKAVVQADSGAARPVSRRPAGAAVMPRCGGKRRPSRRRFTKRYLSSTAAARRSARAIKKDVAACWSASAGRATGGPALEGNGSAEPPASSVVARRLPAAARRAPAPLRRHPGRRRLRKRSAGAVVVLTRC